jgi:hypothetical protein
MRHRAPYGIVKNIEWGRLATHTRRNAMDRIEERTRQRNNPFHDDVLEHADRADGYYDYYIVDISCCRCPLLWVVALSFVAVPSFIIRSCRFGAPISIHGILFIIIIIAQH